MDDEQRITVAWEAAGGELALPLDLADWLGAALSVLVAAIHHPDALTAQQPDTDPADVARQALDELELLQEAAEVVEGHDWSPDGPPTMALRRDGPRVWIRPGGEIRALMLVLDVFAKAVLDPDGADARTARGALAYSASEWSRELEEVCAS